MIVFDLILTKNKMNVQISMLSRLEKNYDFFYAY